MDIHGVNNAHLTPMQRLLQQAAVTKAVDVPIGQTSSSGNTGFYPGLSISPEARMEAFLNPNSKWMTALDEVCCH